MLFPYRTHLEAELKQQRADFETRLAEKNLQIRVLRCELAAMKSQPVETSETQVQPAVQPAPLEQDWHMELKQMLQEEEDGIRSRGRIQEHEPRTDDGA